jgi:acetyltransferase-like isoleucine patch superfamily enzyme
MISSTAKIFPNVKIGKNVTIEDFCIIGIPPHGKDPEETVIGDNSIIRAQTIIYSGNKIGENFQTGNKVNIRESNIIGDNVSIGTMSIVEHHVKIEDDVRVHSQAFIPEYCELQKGCWVGPGVVLTNAKYPNSPNAKKELAGVVLKQKCRIGANSTLLPGVQIGHKSLVGAGSVVCKDVEDFEVVVGSPAKKISNVHY